MNIRVKQIRKRLGLTRPEFSEFLGLTSRSLMNIELGSRNPNRLTIKVIGFLASISKRDALAFIKELNRHD